jgi:endonuclease YncB( thermonuclease family)
VREKLESGKPLDSSLDFIEIRAKTPFTYFAKLNRVIDGDTLLIEFDVGFFITLKEKVRLIGINALEINTAEGKKAKAFVEKELEDANLIVETRKKEKFGRFLAFVYYSKQHEDFEDIIRHGKLLNAELVKAGLAVKYGD